jgi:hypothetical protein
MGKMRGKLVAGVILASTMGVGGAVLAGGSTAGASPSIDIQPVVNLLPGLNPVISIQPIIDLPNGL